MYYDYPPPTYMEYPILIAQGEFQNQNTASPGGIRMLVVTVKSITWIIIPSGLSLPLHWHLPDTCFNILHKNLAKKIKIWSRSKWPWRLNQSYFIFFEAARSWMSYLKSNFFFMLFPVHHNLFCVLRLHPTAADFSLWRPPGAESHLHPAVSFRRFLDVKHRHLLVPVSTPRYRLDIMCSGSSAVGGSSLWRSGSLIRPW